MSRMNVLFLVAVVAAGSGPAGAQETYELLAGEFRQVAGPEAGSAAESLLHIRKALAAGEGENAAELASTWIAEHGDHPALAEAYLVRGDALASSQFFYEALRDYEFLVRRYPNSPHFHTALEREMKIASAFARGTKRKLWGMRILSAK
ncbi:MAG: hypothetical protein OER86_10060, partial [Phycisphaerae bacterium]|nr:hypothetical protein [Phycisphaerae bacterium]